AQPTDSTVSNPGGVEDPQRAIAFSPLFRRAQGLASGAAERPVGLEGKVLSREAASFPRGGGGGWAIARCRSRRVDSLPSDRWESRSKLGSAQGSRLKLMPQF